MSRERDTGDIIDRYTIAKLKAERIGDDEHKRELQSFEHIINKIKENIFVDSRQGKPVFHIDSYIKMMYDINDFIWQLEAGLKGGKEELVDPYYILHDKNEKVLAKIGVTAILNRHFNHLRISLKNIINEQLGEGFQDKKKDHVSS